MHVFVTEDPASLQAARDLAERAQEELVAGVFREMEELIASREPGRMLCDYFHLSAAAEAAMVRDRDPVAARLAPLAFGQSSEDDGIRLFAADLLAKVDPGRGDRALLELVESEDRAVRESALFHLATGARRRASGREGAAGPSEVERAIA